MISKIEEKETFSTSRHHSSFTHYSLAKPEWKTENKKSKNTIPSYKKNLL